MLKILLALIPVLGSIFVAWFTADKTAEARIAQLNIVSGGTVSKNCSSEGFVGRHVTLSGKEGECRVSFDRQYPSLPVVVLTGDGGTGAAIPLLKDVTTSGFRVQGADPTHGTGLAAVGFTFLVLHPQDGRTK